MSASSIRVLFIPKHPANTSAKKKVAWVPWNKLWKVWYFFCRSDSQRIEHCDGTSEGIKRYFRNEFYRMLFPWCTVWALSPKAGSWIFNLNLNLPVHWKPHSQACPARTKHLDQRGSFSEAAKASASAWRRRKSQGKGNTIIMGILAGPPPPKLSPRNKALRCLKGLLTIGFP